MQASYKYEYRYRRGGKLYYMLLPITSTSICNSRYYCTSTVVVALPESTYEVWVPVRLPAGIYCTILGLYKLRVFIYSYGTFLHKNDAGRTESTAVLVPISIVPEVYRWNQSAGSVYSYTGTVRVPYDTG